MRIFLIGFIFFIISCDQIPQDFSLGIPGGTGDGTGVVVPEPEPDGVIPPQAPGRGFSGIGG